MEGPVRGFILSYMFPEAVPSMASGCFVPILSPHGQICPHAGILSPAARDGDKLSTGRFVTGLRHPFIGRTKKGDPDICPSFCPHLSPGDKMRNVFRAVRELFGDKMP